MFVIADQGRFRVFLSDQGNFNVLCTNQGKRNVCDCRSRKV